MSWWTAAQIGMSLLSGAGGASAQRKQLRLQAAKLEDQAVIQRRNRQRLLYEENYKLNQQIGSNELARASSRVGGGSEVASLLIDMDNAANALNSTMVALQNQEHALRKDASRLRDAADSSSMKFLGIF